MEKESQQITRIKRLTYDGEYYRAINQLCDELSRQNGLICSLADQVVELTSQVQTLKIRLINNMEDN